VSQTVERFFAQPEWFQDLWSRVLEVISKMRVGGVSLSLAAREQSVDPRTVLRLASSALRRLPSGRYVAKARDRLLRVLVVVTNGGLREVGVRDSRIASLIGKHWAAVRLYLDTGDASGLRQFRGRFVSDGDGARFLLLTSLNELDHLASAGVLSFETVYAKR
jgi:hypothetical protein